MTSRVFNIRIEVAKSGRSQCRVCKIPIKRGELRFVEIVDMSHGASDNATMDRYIHLSDAAALKPQEFLTAVRQFVGEVPDLVKLKRLATKKAKELDAFVSGSRWTRSERNNLVLKGNKPTITVFHTETKAFNWAVDKTFGEGFFASEDEAKRDLWRHLESMK